MMDSIPAGPEPLRPALLWKRFAAPLRSFVAKRAPRELDPEDLVQDIFVRIQTHLPNLRDADRIDAWIFQIARNVVADAFRERARSEALASRDPRESTAPTTDADERAAEAALVSCLATMIAQLPEPYRHAVELTEIEGLTQGDAARLAGISVSGMKSRVQRGREQLKRIIQEVCLIETDVRGRVIECDPRGHRGCGEMLRPLASASDSMDMMNRNEAKGTETGTKTEETSNGCCGGPAPHGANACCALDADVKDAGGTGCGCGTKPAKPATKGCC